MKMTQIGDTPLSIEYILSRRNTDNNTRYRHFRNHILPQREHPLLICL